MSSLAAYLQLTKPRLLPLVLMSGLPALVMAAGHWPSPGLVLVILGGTAVAAGAANALNCYIERDRDRQMNRTATRPLPAGLLRPAHALAFALAMTALGPGLLALGGYGAAAGVALAGIAFYVFVYTIWLKPRSSFAVVVGGVAGAVAPLIADAAIGGHISAAGWLLFAIVFVWQPPHFWAITLYRRDEYENAGFPLMVSRVGERVTQRRILLWIAALVPLSLAPVALGLLGIPYAVVAAALGAWFFASGVHLIRECSDEAARGVFRVSLLYLMVLLTAMIADLGIRGVLA